MSSLFWQNVISGVAVGSTFSLLAVGISQIFAVTRVLNFGHAALAMVAAYVYSWLGLVWGWPVVVAALASVALVTAMGLLVEPIFRSVMDASTTTKVVVSLGILGLARGLVMLQFGVQPRRSLPLVEGGWIVGSVQITYQELLVFLAAATAVIGLVAFLHYSTIGLGVRAMAENREVAELHGVSSAMTSRLNWAIGTFLAGVAGVLVAPLLFLTVDTFTAYLVFAIAAALFGGLSGVVGAFVGGLVIGVTRSVVSAYVDSPGFELVAIFLIMVVGLIVARRRWPAEFHTQDGRLSSGHDRHGSSLYWLMRLAVGAAWVALIVAAIGSDFWALIGALVVIYALATLSLVVVTGWSGQISFGQGALMGVGAFALLHLHSGFGWAFPVAVGGAVAAGAFAGGLFGLLTWRLAPMQVAVVSVAATLAAAGWLFSQRLGPGEQLAVPGYLDSGRSLFFASGIALLGMLFLVRNARKSGWWLHLVTSRDAPAVAEHFGASVLRLRASAFSLSGAIAALGGCFLAIVLKLLPPSSFGVGLSTTVFIIAVVSGIGSLIAPLVGPLLFIAGPHVFTVSQTSANALPDILGGALILLLLVRRPGGLRSLLDPPQGSRRDRRRPDPAVAVLRLPQREPHHRLRRVVAAGSSSSRSGATWQTSSSGSNGRIEERERVHE